MPCLPRLLRRRKAVAADQQEDVETVNKAPPQRHSVVDASVQVNAEDKSITVGQKALRVLMNVGPCRFEVKGIRCPCDAGLATSVGATLDAHCDTCYHQLKAHDDYGSYQDTHPMGGRERYA
jgi:hypothetical protein